MDKFDNKDAIYMQSLLHKDYHDCKIIVFDNVMKFIKYALFKYESPTILNRFNYLKETLFTYRSLGVYTSVIQEVHILNFHIRKFQKDNEELAFAQVVFHELRHYWQDKMGYFNELNIEKDALKFHLRMISKEDIRRKVNDYFGIE